MSKIWVIRHINGTDYWSNLLGWVTSRKDADEFSDADKMWAQLPIDGEWIETQRPRQAPLMRKPHMKVHILSIDSDEVDEYAGEINLATIIPVRNSSQLGSIINTPIINDGDGRSQWCWCRFANGDLMLGFFPQGEIYELASAMEQEDRTDG